MHLKSVLATSLAVSGTLAYPGMNEQLSEIQSRTLFSKSESNELLGDLVTLKDRELTKVGKDIKGLLQGKGNPQSDERYNNVPALNSPQCKKDTCCVWRYVADDMYQFMAGSSGRCTKWARAAVRLGFHDAGTWSKATASQGGGADGSFILAGEISRFENRGLEEITARFTELYGKYKDMGWDIGMGDFIQMGANVATVICPLGPRVKSYVGRKDSDEPNPEGLLPSPFAPADQLIQLFKDKTISPHGLVALLGAHTTSQQRFVDPARAGDPQDSTPGVWDVLYYKETLSNTSPPRVFKFPSDIALSQHPETKKEFKEFAGLLGQYHWNEDYAREYIRLSLLGVNNINQLTECTKVLPPTTKGFRIIDQFKLDKWLNSVGNKGAAKKASEDIENGDTIQVDVPANNNRN
ncbi:ligninase h2 precursor [Colletotrichum karsti]|uniref:Peroxidase n=1 Tax=Colletotrichum karsti TaxID=1095194 RepID=A0A9P6I995_9PEZI|nr:ligninase h2 precursor [Colletotrichum karsti]KAF9877511.1 ligninase h2 precursor [Colletotrichum karsti]